MAASTRIYLGINTLFGRASLVLGILITFQNQVTLSLGEKESLWRSNDTYVVVLNNASKHYLEKIFQVYASNITGNIPKERFQNLLDVLHIGEATKFAEEQKRQQRKSIDLHLEERDESQVAHEIKASSEKLKQGQKQSESGSAFKNKCPSKNELLTEHGIKTREGVSPGNFVQLCPALVYLVESGICDAEHDNDEHATQVKKHTDWKKVWGYGVLSITIISLSSLMVIAIIPLIGRSVYDQLMSFLVALAVGTMAGDAILHLIPHALIPSTHTDNHSPKNHSDAILKSCVILAGIYLLFIVESVMKSRFGGHSHTHAQSGYHNAHQHNEKKRRSDTIADKMHTCQASKSCSTHQNNMIASRLAGVHGYNSCCDKTFGFPKFGKSSKLASGGVKTAKSCMTVASNCNTTKINCSQTISDRSESVTSRKKYFSDSELALSVSKNAKSEYEYMYPIEFSDLKCVKNNCDIISTKSSSYSETTETILLEKAVVLESKVPSGNALQPDHKENYSHHGNKVIDVTTSIASVAWMVIVSDGFHNFSDGLAVGAAFSTSLATGLTTAIAVYCHEIPHELGDFAILIKSGMSMKQALAYNMVSVVISYIGLILGILIGNIQFAHLWVLALTAGMFLYVSLVDMLPELRSYTSQGGIMIHICQNSGMIVGILIMLIIALLEQKI